MALPVVDKRDATIRRMFAGIAHRYDLLNHLLSLHIDRLWRKRVTKLVPIRNGGPILDLCTGTGDLALAYDRACGGTVTIAAADFCSEMLVRAADKAQRAGAATRIHFAEADAQQLPFANDTFEITAVAFGLRNVTNLDRGIAEMVRVTRPGGRVAILEFSKPRNWFFSKVYRLYFRFALPLIGQMVSRSRDSAYRYLPNSVMEFPDYEALVERLRHHGLVQVTFNPFTFGIATLYVGTKER